MIQEQWLLQDHLSALSINHDDAISNDLFAETIGELRGFVDSLTFDNLIIAGEINVDFSRSNSDCSTLQSFFSDLNVSVVDLASSNDIQFTYERDDGLVRTWPDHVLTLSCHSESVSNISCWHSADNFSDYIPLYFEISPYSDVHGTPPSSVPSSLSSRQYSTIDWNRITSSDTDFYCQSVLNHLPSIPSSLYICTDASCKSHQEAIEHCCEDFISCVHSSALQCLPHKPNNR